MILWKTIRRIDSRLINESGHPLNLSSTILKWKKKKNLGFFGNVRKVIAGIC